MQSLLKIWKMKVLGQIFADPKSLGKTKIQTIFPSQNADYVILDKPTTKKLKGKEDWKTV